MIDTSRHTLYSLPAFTCYIMSLLVGLLFALVMPTLSVLVAEGLGVRPLLVGVFFVLMSASSIVFSHLLALWSDKVQDRRPLILLGMVFGALSCAVFALSSNYWTLLSLGTTLFALSFAFTSQIFAHAREFADQKLTLGQNTLFNSIVRAGVAVAWVSGPPIGFALYNGLGISMHYGSVAVAYVLTGVCAWLLLPHTDKVVTEHLPPIPASHKTQVMIAIAAFSFLYACNQTYLISLPLYLPEHLQLDSHYAGWIMGTAAALEIPVMIFGGWLGTRYPLISLIRIGGLCAGALYLGVWNASELWHLFVLQILNAVFIGFVAGLGMTWFQDMMPGKAGAASSLYLNSNNIGNLLGSLVVAVFAEALGYRHIFLIMIAIAACAVITLTLLNRFTRSSK